VSSQELELGPVDIVVIGFPPDAAKSGDAIPLFVDLVDRGIIRVLDVLIVSKEQDGSIAGMEIGDLDHDGLPDLVVFEGARSGMLGDEDAQVAGEGMEPGEAAVMICYENTWAAPFISAVRRNGGRVLAAERISAQDLLDVAEALDAGPAS
jgi:hypothetical protein